MMRAAALARTFAEHDVGVIVVLRDLADCSLAIWPNDIRLLQAPVSFRTPPQFTKPSTYAELLYTNGYHDPRLLDGLTAGWTTLLDMLEPDLIVVDHAPTAILAAKLMDIRSVRLGTGFFAPPPIQPFPSYRTWQTVDAERAQAVERYVLAAINAVVNAANLQFGSVFDALQPDVDLISSWPELDHYGAHRRNATVQYIGNEVTVSAGGVVKPWPLVSGKRILAYLKNDYSALADVIRGLQNGAEHVQAYISGLNAEQAMTWSNERLTISNQPFDLHDMLKHCDGMICHAGSGTVALCLEHNVPVFLLPYTAEQFLYAQCVAQCGFGVMQSDLDARTHFHTKFPAFLAQDQFARCIEAAKTKNQHLPSDAITYAVVRCIELLQ